MSTKTREEKEYRALIAKALSIMTYIFPEEGDKAHPIMRETWRQSPFLDTITRKSRLFFYQLERPIVTRLAHACINCTLDTAIALIECGANVHFQDEIKRSTLIYAIFGGYNVAGRNIALINFLVEKKVDINLADSKYGYTPLFYAILYDHIDSVELVKCLCDNGAQLDVLDNEHKTALWHACYLGKIEIVRELLKRGANVNIGLVVFGSVFSSTRKKVSYYIGIQNGVIPVVQCRIFKLLLEYNVELNVFDTNGNSVLSLAIKLNPRLLNNTLQYFDFDLPTNHQALPNACYFLQRRVCKKLIQRVDNIEILGQSLIQACMPLKPHLVCYFCWKKEYGFCRRQGNNVFKRYLTKTQSEYFCIIREKIIKSLLRRGQELGLLNDMLTMTSCSTGESVYKTPYELCESFIREEIRNKLRVQID
jgi:ankyrin repeat protein